MSSATYREIQQLKDAQANTVYDANDVWPKKIEFVFDRNSTHDGAKISAIDLPEKQFDKVKTFKRLTAQMLIYDDGRMEITGINGVALSKKHIV